MSSDPERPRRRAASEPCPYAAGMDNVELRTERIAAGGDALGHLPDGRVVFVDGALPGELVDVELTEQRKDMARGTILRVLEPSEFRREAPCANVSRGCGGCSWQHVVDGHQLALKVDIVVDALRRVGRMPDAASFVRAGAAVAPFAWRTTARAAVHGSSPGFREAEGHRVCVTGPCMVTHPQVSRVIAEGRFPGAKEILVRTSVATGATVVVVDGPMKGVRVPELDGPLTLLAATDLNREVLGEIYEDIMGTRLRVSARSFFQSGPAAAELLVAQVRADLEGTAPDAFVDLYGGVGLFAALVGQGVANVAVVEDSPTAVADAKLNVGEHAQVHRSSVEGWTPPRGIRRAKQTVVVADPARAGLGREAVATVLGCAPATLVLVSCDAASMARDVGLLRDGGYQLLHATVLDLFPQTAHVEVVSVLVPASSAQ